MQKGIDAIQPEAIDLLCRYSWPGNVRELENIMERAVALVNGPMIRVADLPDYIHNVTIETYRHTPSDIPTLEDQEKRYIQWVLEKKGGNKTKAAKIMGIDRVSLWRKLKRYGIE
jgi:transcriptional regulator with PAS, ATPase and Fis domain